MSGGRFNARRWYEGSVEEAKKRCTLVGVRDYLVGVPGLTGRMMARSLELDGAGCAAKGWRRMGCRCKVWDSDAKVPPTSSACSDMASVPA